jgi:hypothetical protein
VVILRKIFPLALGALAILFIGNAIARPAMASQTAQALTSAGTGAGSALSSAGMGISDFLGGIGTGAAQLFNPLFTLKTLIGLDTSEQTNEIREVQNASNITPSQPMPNTSSSGPSTSGSSSGWSTSPSGTVSASVGGATFSSAGNWGN